MVQNFEWGDHIRLVRKDKSSDLFSLKERVV